MKTTHPTTETARNTEKNLTGEDAIGPARVRRIRVTPPGSVPATAPAWPPSNPSFAGALGPRPARESLCVKETAAAAAAAAGDLAWGDETRCRCACCLVSGHETFHKSEQLSARGSNS